MMMEEAARSECPTRLVRTLSMTIQSLPSIGTVTVVGFEFVRRRFNRWFSIKSHRWEHLCSMIRSLEIGCSRSKKLPILIRIDWSVSILRVQMFVDVSQQYSIEGVGVKDFDWIQTFRSFETSIDAWPSIAFQPFDSIAIRSMFRYSSPRLINRNTN